MLVMAASNFGFRAIAGCGFKTSARGLNLQIKTGGGVGVQEASSADLGIIVDIETLKGIKKRLVGVVGKPWKYEPNHPMFVGTTNALDIYYGHIDLGRNHKEWYEHKDEHSTGYRLTEASIRQMARIKALGEFLERCREDIAVLLDEIEGNGKR